jgi:rubrerythrin
MSAYNTIDEILDFAIASEQGAVDLYSRLADNSRNSEIRDIFIQFAKEEMGHKAKLLKIKSEGIFEGRPSTVTDLKISDFMSEVEPTPNMDYRDALIFAMSNEKAAFRLYSSLAEQAPNEALKNIFHSLAQEEARHKLRFEVEYDEFVLRDN